MRAVVLRSFGPPDGLVVEAVPDPVPEAGQVVVAVEIASITFVETQVRAGRPPHPSMAPPLPAVLGNGVAGRVIAVGSGVDRGLLDRRVVTTTGGLGGYAERVAVPAAGLIDVPEGLALADAAALLADGRTALGLIDLAVPVPGETVLIEAAAGGVGSLLVQLARGAGASVVGAAGGADKVSVVESLGAELAVDYLAAGWVEEVAARAGSIDVVFDGVGGSMGRTGWQMLRPGGRFVPYGMASGSFTAIPEGDAELRGIAVLRGPPRSPAQLDELSRRALSLASAGMLRPLIGQTFPLEGAKDAHTAIEGRRTVGKTLLLVRSERS